MRISCKYAIAGLAISLLSTIGATAAIAQDVLLNPAPARSTTVPPLEFRSSILEAFDNAYFYDDRDFFKNRSFTRQLDLVFGIGFPDREIANDGREVNQLYDQVMARQLASGPIIRVFDLPNPFCQTLLTLPPAGQCGIVGCPSVGCALPAVPPPIPPSAVPLIPPAVEVPAPLPPQANPNVPALW